MTIFLYALSAWCAVSVIVGALLARAIHNSKVRDKAGINSEWKT